MNTTTPSKYLVRQWLKGEVSKHRPPPHPEEIRRELGWSLIEAERNMKRKR